MFHQSKNFLELNLIFSDQFIFKWSHDEIIERLNNLEVKINNHENLNDDEALDIVFLSMFASKSTSCEITEKVTHLFHKNKSLTGMFRGDIAYGLSIMIRKYFDLTDKGKELLKMIEREIDTSKLRDVIDIGSVISAWGLYHLYDYHINKNFSVNKFL